MPSNVEIKAKAADRERQLALARPLADSEAELEQEDVFFNCPDGRLKLRRIAGKGAELIFYRRPDREGPKTSVYFKVPVTEPEAMAGLLAGALGRGKTVRKRRTLLMHGRTRIHFDRVEGLGDFIELEVCLKDGEDPVAGERTAAELMKRLGIAERDLLRSAYADMI